MVPDGMLDTSKLLSPEFFIKPRCPPGTIPTEAITIDVRSGEAMIALEREVPATILEANISEASEHLSTAEVGLGNEPYSFARVTEESEESDISGRR